MRTRRPGYESASTIGRASPARIMLSLPAVEASTEIALRASGVSFTDSASESTS